MLKIGSRSNLEGEFQVKISLLDDTELTSDFKRDVKGHALFDHVAKSLDLLEKDYFGLRYVDEAKQRHWLDLDKNAVKQMKSLKPPYKLFFRVKFYAVDPAMLHEEITRYQFFLQVKRDVLHGRLLCTFNELAELGGHIVQAELGDYDSEEHGDSYVSEFRIVPKQSEKLEKKIGDSHKQLAGQVPSDVEGNFLAKVKDLDMYGVDPHPCKDQDNVQLYLGLTPIGIAIIREGKKVSGFEWTSVVKCSYESKVFYVQVTKDEQRANYGFRLPDPLACKHLWKCAVEHHAFYSGNVKPAKPKRRLSAVSPHRLFKRNKYRYSGRTYDQVIAESEKINRLAPEIRRTASVRISRRLRDPAENVTESTGDLALPKPPPNLSNSPPPVGQVAAELKKFETDRFPETPPPEDSLVVNDMIDSPPLNHVANDVSKSAEVKTKPADVEYYGLKMFIFVMFILALIMIPIAIVWETRKNHIKASAAYKGLARWALNSFGVNL